MEPALQRGDLLFLSMSNEPIAIGDVCVFKLPGRDVPIVHRVIKLHEDKYARPLLVARARSRSHGALSPVLTHCAHARTHGGSPSDGTGEQLILTKGDNNHVDDRNLYTPGQVWIHREDIIGRAKL